MNTDIQRKTAARYYAELADRAREEAERNARVRDLLQDCHKRIAGSPVVWGDRDLLQRISEEVMEARHG